MDETFGTSYPLWYYLLNAAIIITVLTVAFLVLRGILRFALKNKERAGSLATKTAAATIEATKQAVANVKSAAASVPSNVQRTQRQDDAYARAAEEIEQAAMHKGLWARAFADAEGNEQKQKALYVRYRAEQIAKEAP
ncbi:MAG: hypothetical protein ABL956_06895 [Hyphomonadaceae bacterium]